MGSDGGGLAFPFSGTSVLANHINHCCIVGRTGELHSVHANDVNG